MPRLKALSQKKLLDLHQHQYDGSHRNPNECGLCSMAMLLEMGAQQSGASLQVDAAALGRELDRIPFRFPRFPAWFPGPGGATHPLAAYWGLQRKLSQLNKQGTDLPWRPRLRFRQQMDDLAAELEPGHPSLIYGVGRTGIPHVVVPIAREGSQWQLLDPAYSAKKNPRTWSDETLSKWWRNYGWLYPRGTMINLRPL